MEITRLHIRLLALAMLVATVLAADELVMVQVIWRHGDRSPTKTFKNDPNQESAWPLGFGQLTVEGMEQHMILGNLLYDEYVAKNKFLDTSLSYNQMYVRSTDVNRTLISAYTNLYGMYYNRTASKPGVNFPDVARWPGLLVPFPVHTTLPYKQDNVGQPLYHCPRREWLWEQAKKSPEVVKMINDNKDLFDNLTKVTGDVIDIDNIWYVRDAIFIEKLHNKPVLAGLDYLFPRIDLLVDLLENYEEGMNISAVDGIDFNVEIPKVRGGFTLWSMINNFDLKLHCLDPVNAVKYECEWMKNMKYYAYSAHDNTISALLAALGAKDEVVPYGYPEYSSCLSLELWNTAQGPSIKMLYHANYTEGFSVHTKAIFGCENLTNEKCPYTKIQERAKIYYPGKSEEGLCLDTVSKNTNMWAPQATTTPPTTTTSGATGSRISLLSIAMMIGFVLKMA